MKKILLSFSVTASTVAAALAQTQTVGQINSGPIFNLLKFVSQITGMLVPILISLAVLAFFWYLVKFIMQGGQSADAKAASIKGMGYSVLALFVMVSIWGIVALLGSIVGVGQGGEIPMPVVPTLR